MSKIRKLTKAFILKIISRSGEYKALKGPTA